MLQQPERWLTIRDAAARYGLTMQALYHRVHRGTVPYSRLGKRVYIDTLGLERLLQRGQVVDVRAAARQLRKGR